MSTFLLIKIYFIIRLLPRLTSAGTERMKRVCVLNGFRPDLLFYFKLALLDYSFTLITFSMLTFIVFTGLIVQIFERGIFSDSIKQGSFDNFSNSWNSLWLIVISITGVGYGDIIPVTKLGRLITFTVCFIGNFIVQLLTVSIMRKLEMTSRQ